MSNITIPAILPNQVGGSECLAASGETFPKLDPATGKEMFQVARSRDADVARSQCRRIVQSIAHHRDGPSGLLQVLDRRHLRVREHFRDCFLDVGAPRDCICRLTPIAREHQDMDASGS